MKSYEQLAASAYAAYCKQQGQRLDTWVADDVPRWDQLDDGTRQCWIAATKQVVAEAALVH